MSFSGFFRESAFNMRAFCTNSVLLLLVSCCSGCKTTPRRPNNVPASAVRIEGVFIDCSIEETSHANRCTVYKESSGEVQVSGLFALSGAGREASGAELRYVAFDGSRIWLQDARTLQPVWLEEYAAPGMVNRLAALAGGDAENCGRVARNQKPRKASDCARRAYADRRPFFVSYDQNAVDRGYTLGFAGDRNGGLYFVQYMYVGWPTQPPSENVRFSDDNRIRFGPCPKPLLFERNNGELTCIPSTE
jgi:hypothetical protein